MWKLAYANQPRLVEFNDGPSHLRWIISRLIVECENLHAVTRVEYFNNAELAAADRAQLISAMQHSANVNETPILFAEFVASSARTTAVVPHLAGTIEYSGATIQPDEVIRPYAAPARIAVSDLKSDEYRKYKRLDSHLGYMMRIMDMYNYISSVYPRLSEYLRERRSQEIHMLTTDHAVTEIDVDRIGKDIDLIRLVARSADDELFFVPKLNADWKPKYSPELYARPKLLQYLQQRYKEEHEESTYFSEEALALRTIEDVRIIHDTSIVGTSAYCKYAPQSVATAEPVGTKPVTDLDVAIASHLGARRSEEQNNPALLAVREARIAEDTATAYASRALGKFVIPDAGDGARGSALLKYLLERADEEEKSAEPFSPQEQKLRSITDAMIIQDTLAHHSSGSDPHSSDRVVQDLLALEAEPDGTKPVTDLDIALAKHLAARRVAEFYLAKIPRGFETREEYLKHRSLEDSRTIERSRESGRLRIVSIWPRGRRAEAHDSDDSDEMPELHRLTQAD